MLAILKIDYLPSSPVGLAVECCIEIIIVFVLQRHRGAKTKAPFLPLGSTGVSSKQIYTAVLDSAERKVPDDMQWGVLSAGVFCIFVRV